MKILFSTCHYVYDEISGGSEFSWAFNVANRIASENIDSIVVTGFAKLESEKSYKIVELQKRSDFIDVSAKNAIHFNWKYFIETVRQLRSNSFDIVHHVLPFRVGVTFNLAVMFGFVKIPFVLGPIQNPLTYQDTDINSSNIRNAQVLKKKIDYFQIFYRLFTFILCFFSDLTLKKAQRVIAINAHTRDILIKRGVKTDLITVIPPGIDIKKFEFIPFDEKKSDRIELLVVCYLLKRKAVDLVIKAVSKVVKGKNNIILRIVGDGPQKKNLENLVKELGLQDYIIFEGFVENHKIQEYYKKADIFLNMSRSEGFATVCLEAMASGLAIVSSKVGGFQEAIKDGENGYLIEQENIKELAERMIYLIDHPDVIASFGKKARQEVEEKYDWDKVIIPQYLELYNEIIKK